MKNYVFCSQKEYNLFAFYAHYKGNGIIQEIYLIWYIREKILISYKEYPEKKQFFKAFFFQTLWIVYDYFMHLQNKYSSVNKIYCYAILCLVVSVVYRND